MKTLIIPADGSAVRWEDPAKIDLDYLQDAVGGMIEAVDIDFPSDPGDQATMYLHEEGKLVGLPLNERANRLARKYSGIGLTDYIVGTVVLVGAVDQYGEETGLNPRVRAQLEKELKEEADG
jgi:hypothetical protein